MGHARALLALDDPKTQIRIFNEIIAQGYSVRKVEEIVKALSAGESVESGGKKIAPKGANCPKNIPCCRIICVHSSVPRYSCRAATKEKVKSVFPSTTKPIWKESWRYWTH